MTAGLLVFHGVLPDSAGSLVETFLPWFGLVVVVLLILALVRRSAAALVALLLPAAAWAYGFGGLLLPVGKPGGHDLVVVQHNVSDENTDPAGRLAHWPTPGPISSRWKSWCLRRCRFTRRRLRRVSRITRFRAPSGFGRGIR
ncbi:hypothetical protein [Actinomadura sp. B10D3]|uniref:hypothetical protein n=1 Tax=Actinomadura sp. B10D3 TaxID=3153557 RepID=UPI00325CFB8D